MSLRILHTESSWGWGGQELRILTESQALAARGHAVCIAAPGQTPILARASDMGLETIALPIRKKNLQGFRAMRRLLRERVFDVVNTHSSTDAWLVALAMLGMHRRPAVVRTRHVSTPVRAGLANRWLFARATNRVVTTGEIVRKALIDQVGLAAEHVISVPTGVDGTLYRPVHNIEEQATLRDRLQIHDGVTVLGTVATLRLLKGMDHLFRAMARLRHLPIHLYVVGDGPQMASLQRLLDELDLRSKVSMVGEQSNVDQWLRAMDVFVFPSLAEGVPQALTQAMLTGLPCVTTDVGGIPELARHLETAWVCPPADPQALADGITTLLDDRTLRERLAAGARRHCLATRSIATMADAMEVVFMDAAASHS